MPWVLLPDRLYLPDKLPKFPRAIEAHELQGLSLDGRTVKAQLHNETIALQSNPAPRLFSLLRLLQSPWLAGLRSPAGESMVIEAVDDTSKESGRALIFAEGVLFVPKARRALMLEALTAEVLPVEVSLDEVLGLIAHLPAGRWDALTEHLAKAADVFWFPRGAITVEENVVSSGEKRVRLVLVREPRRLEAKVLLDRLR